MGLSEANESLTAMMNARSPPRSTCPGLVCAYITLGSILRGVSEAPRLFSSIRELAFLRRQRDKRSERGRGVPAVTSVWRSRLVSIDSHTTPRNTMEELQHPKPHGGVTSPENRMEGNRIRADDDGG